MIKINSMVPFLFGCSSDVNRRPTPNDAALDPSQQPDSFSQDALSPSVIDAGRDAGRVDVISSATKDAGRDGRLPDRGAPDASVPDAYVADSGLDAGAMIDGAIPDARIPDAASPDSGASSDGGVIPSCEDGDPSASLQIHWLKNQIGSFGFVDSYQGDGTIRAYTYDQALSIIAFAQADETCEARQVIEALAARQRDNGSWRTCHLAEEPGIMCESWVHTGPVAWVVMALNFYENRTGDASYAGVANRALGWLDGMRDTDPASETYGSLKYGEGYPQNRISTEHNLDAYSAYYYRGLLESNDDYIDKANLIQDYLLSEMWGLSPDSDGPFEVGVFWRGWQDFAWCTDPQSWGVLALGPSGPGGETLSGALEWLTTYGYGFGSTRNEQNLDGLPVDGFSFCTEDVNPPNGINPNFCGTLFVWPEGTEGVAAAHYAADDIATGDYFHDQISQTVSVSGGLPYSFSAAETSWPCHWPYASAASTSWYYFNEAGINPFRP